jgi:DHA1 family multidrug resistance protein-like MFS transporter
MKKSSRQAGSETVRESAVPLVRLFAIVLSSSIGFFVIVPILPLFLADIAGTRQAAVWTGPVVAASFLTSALLSPFWGSLSDRFGARRMMLRAASAIVLTQALLIFCHSPAQVLAVRLLHGCFAGLVPAAMTYAVRCAGPSGQSLAALSVARSAGAMLGPGLGGVLVATTGFSSAFLVASGLLALSTLGVCTLKPDQGDRSLEKRESFLHKLSRLANSGRLRGALAVTVAVTVFAGAVQVAIPLSLQDDDGLSPQARAMWLGIILSAGGIASTVAGIPWGRAADRYGWQRLLPGVTLGSGVAVGLMPFVESPLWLAGTFVLYSLIACEISTLISLCTLAVTPEERHGTLMGLSHTVNQIGFAAGPLLGGFLITATSPLWVYVTVAAGMLVLAGGAFARRRGARSADLSRAAS